MGKQKIDISVFDEAVKKVDISAFDEAVKKKEPSASSAEPSRTQPTQQEQQFELPSNEGKDTTERQGRLGVPDFGQIEEPPQSAAAIADDLGVTTQDLKITEVLQDPKAKQSNLGRPLPTSGQYKINGKPVYRDEMIDVINNQVNKIQAGTVDVEILDDPELQSRLQRQVQSGSRGGDILESLGAGLVSTAQSLEGLPSLVAATIEEITGLPTTETSIAIQSRLNAMDLGRKAEEIREKTRAYEGNFLESLLNGNFVDAAAQGMNLTMESLPITAISAVTGGGGSIGSYLLRSAATLTPIMASREFSESQVSQDPDIQNLEQSQKVLRSWLYGGAEALGESVTGRIASKNFDILKGSLKSTVGRAAAEVGEDGARQTARQIAKNTAIDIAKNMGVDMNQEGISEAVTEMTQMLTDDLMGVKSYSFGDYAEQMSNAYASGAFMGAVMGLGGAVGVSADAVKKYRSTTYQNIAKGLERSVANGEITEVEANAVKADAAAISQTNPTLSDKAQAAQASLIKERNGLEQFLEGVDKAAAPKEYERINQINQELTKIAENDETSKEDQGLLEAEIRQENEQEKLREEEQTRNVVGSDVRSSVMAAVDGIADNETVTITTQTLEEIPKQFRGRAERVEGASIEKRKTFLGIPYGKVTETTVGDGFRYSATGAELKSMLESEQLIDEKQITDEKTVLEELSDDRIQEEVGQESPELRTEEKEQIAESIGKSRKVKPKNIKGLLDVMGGIFGLNKPQAESAAVVGDVMVETMSKRAGVSKDEMYQRISFTKAQAKDLPQGAKLQVDAWHGSPYQFDKFTTQAIGTGEGAQAFGWGLYFTDLKSIARNYAEALTPTKVIVDGKVVDRREDFFLYKAAYDIANLGYERAVERNKELVSDGDSDAKGILDAIEGLKGKNVKFGKDANVYKVSLHKGKTPDQYTWLEWDKPITDTQRKKVSDYIMSSVKMDGYITRQFLNAGFEFDWSNDGRNPTKVYVPQKITGKELYNAFIRANYDLTDNPPKKASMDLLESGIDGIKYPAESIARGATSGTARGFNYVVFDENAVSIEEVIKFQKDAEKVRGAMMMAMDNQAIIYALTDPNVSTPLHELAHVYEHYLTEQERKDIIKWAGHKEWTTETSEKFARGFEKYLSEGKAPTPMMQKYFDQFKNWLMDIYNGIVGSEIDVELNEEMRSIYDQMLTTQEESLGDLQEQPQAEEEAIVAKDKVTVTYEDYKDGKRVTKKRRGVVDSVNEDGTFNIRAREGVYKNISPEGVSKVKSTPTVESETQGLTEKERFVQGFKEIMSAKDEKIRQAKESVKEKLSQASAKFGERMSAQRKKTGEAKTARAELGRLINLEMKELGLSDVRASRVKSMLSSMKNITPNNIDSVIERAYGLVVAEAKAQRLNTYKKKSKEAKRRIQRGDFDTVSVGMIPLMELDVRAILDEDIKRYTELVDDFSRRGKFAVEDVAAKIQEANEIVNRAAEQLGLREVEASNIAQGLTEENYNKAISELVASGDITQDMADFMRANKKRLLELEKKPVNKEQVFFEIQDKIEFVKNNQQDLSDRPVKQKAQDVISSVKREDLENMSDADLSLLNRVLDAMEVGLMPSQASKLAQTIEAQRTANSINEQTQQEKSIVGKMFEAIDTPIRELASGKAKRVRRQMIKSQSTTPDSSFGFKGKAISKALEPFNIAYGELEAQANKYKGMLARAIKNIKKSQASDIRGFLYMAEMHRNANPQSNKAYTVKQLIDVLTGTTEARQTYISNYGEKRYKEILKTYDKFKDENGELDAKKLYESMSKAERDYVSTAEIIFSENTEFARDARWVRGESFEELNYYMHYPVIMQASKSDVNASVDNMMNSGIVRPSTKAGNLEERTEGVKLVSFSLAESVQNSYQQTLEDYYLTQPLRTERKAFNMFEKMNSNNDKMFSFASGVNKGAEDFRRYLLVSKQVSNFNNPITNAIKAGAYRYMLGSTARAVKEVLSNQSYVAMSDLVNFETASFKSFEIAKKTLTEPDWLFKAVANLPISDKQRILGNAVFAGQADAATMLGEDVGFTARAQSLETRIGKGIEAMQDLGITVNIKGNRIRISNKAYMEALLKTPDMFYSRGVFFDKLQRAYKKETGESLDLDKLTDKKFINDNRVLFDKITKEASAAVRKAFSTTNLAERSGVQLRASAEGGMFNAVKYFMLPFVINEYEQLRMAAVEDGLFGGLKTAIPILSRFAVYGALTGALTRAIAAALSDEDEPIEDILPSMDEFMKSLISSVVTLTLQRNWTFAPRAASNYVIEYLNKEFGEGITRESKEYDKFKDNIMFNRMNLDDVMGMRWTEMAQIIAPQYSPLLSSYEAAMKSTDERNKQRKEYLQWKALVTALTGIGFLPRDVRDIYIYSNDDVRDLIFDDKKKGVSGTIKGGSSSGALSGGRGTTIKGAAR